MPIQQYCNNCSHRKLPESIKTKFNTHVKTMFDECPMNDPKVVGCLIKDITIDWKAFIKWLDDHSMLEENEKKVLRILKLYGIDDENAKG